ncbi:MAG: response regulator transcription factor [Longimicrobiales bacterium]|nr:response regulator transcription factor [Longimicrobiales bacterium]
MPDLIIADDHAVVRAGIRNVIEGIEGIHVVAEAGDGEEALGLIREHDPDCVVLDVNMPGMNGLQVVAELRGEGWNRPVLILSMHDDPEYVLEALRAGADGYVLKDASPAEVREALTDVLAGREHLPERVTHQLSVALRADLERDKNRARLEQLTPREREVMLQIARGRTNRETGEVLGISTRTVETHRLRVMNKLRMGSVAELTRFVIELGLDPTPSD